MWETEKFDVAERVAVSKARLSEKLSELGRRVDTFRDKAKVIEYAKQPWFLFAAAGVVGFLSGLRIASRRHRRLALPPGAAPPARPQTIPRAIIKEILVVAAGVATKRFLVGRDQGRF